MQLRTNICSLKQFTCKYKAGYCKSKYFYANYNNLLYSKFYIPTGIFSKMVTNKNGNNQVDFIARLLIASVLCCAQNCDTKSS